MRIVENFEVIEYRFNGIEYSFFVDNKKWSEAIIDEFTDDMFINREKKLDKEIAQKILDKFDLWHDTYELYEEKIKSVFYDEAREEFEKEMERDRKEYEDEKADMDSWWKNTR